MASRVTRSSGNRPLILLLWPILHACVGVVRLHIRSSLSHDATMCLKYNFPFACICRQVRVCEGHCGAREQREAALHSDDVRVQLLCACSVSGISRRQVHAATIGNYISTRTYDKKRNFMREMTIII